MDGGHEPLFDAESIEEDFAEWGEAIGRAGGVAKNGVFLGIVVGVVNAHDVGGNVVFSGGCDEDSLGASGEMLFGVDEVSESSCGFHDVVDFVRFPRELGGIFFAGDDDALSVDEESVSVSLDGASKGAVRGVVFKQIGEVVGGNKVVDGDDFEVGCSQGISKH